MKRVCPLCHRISQSTQVDCTAELEKRERKKLGIEESKDEYFNHVKIRFTAMPEQKFPDGAKPEEITKYSLDYSFALECMLEKMDTNNGKCLNLILFSFDIVIHVRTVLL